MLALSIQIKWPSYFPAKTGEDQIGRKPHISKRVYKWINIDNNSEYKEKQTNKQQQQKL